MEEQKVILSDRDRLMEVVFARLDHIEDIGTTDLSPKMIAALITDDILASLWRVERDTTMLARGKDAGYERALQDAIAAVGEMERGSGWSGGPQNLIEYDQTQRHIARLSNHGMEDLWREEHDDALEGGR
jgi:hypothetical protein